MCKTTQEICIKYYYYQGFPGGAVVRNPVLIPGSGRIPWGRKWQPTPIFMPGKFPSQRSLADYHSPRGCKEWKMTEHRHRHTVLIEVLKRGVKMEDMGEALS